MDIQFPIHILICYFFFFYSLISLCISIWLCSISLPIPPLSLPPFNWPVVTQALSVVTIAHLMSPYIISTRSRLDNHPHVFKAIICTDNDREFKRHKHDNGDGVGDRRSWITVRVSDIHPHIIILSNYLCGHWQRIETEWKITMGKDMGEADDSETFVVWYTLLFNDEVGNNWNGHRKLYPNPKSCKFLNLITRRQLIPH